MPAATTGVKQCVAAPTKGTPAERSLAEIPLQCPRCKSEVADCECRHCGFHIRNIKGVFHALPPERVVYYARFIAEYERIREAEGRGSESDDYYLGLPYNDASRRNSQQWLIRARTFDCLLHRVLTPNLPHDASILDLGAGNCWMSNRLVLNGYKPYAVDLLANDRDGLGAAEHYRRYLPEFFLRFRAELSQLPFRSEQFDAAVFNASFHYAESFEVVLQEALRCCKQNGIVAICDTPWYSRDESGAQMVAERQAAFLEMHGTASDSIMSQEYLTDERLHSLENCLPIRWMIHRPHYGPAWAMRPLMARIRHRREPARFRIYVARKVS